ncbi:hypothetical protein PsYK624_129760 [Phanerochaete sordida]|uniref:Mei2-like C-terminal RNA recognition motif domain-containing protein n=1 Tax=Phanerochaete sordida TaxID=48140 RepID=A0A9P3GKA6_9APHY|nr:hypothetical protein PsYK624_129760 [Phanerochaete sordida]
MEPHTVPFPSVSRFNDELSPERRNNDRTPHGRVNSSPSLPDWSFPFGHSGARPRLHPLDLAVGPPSTPPLSAKHLQPFPSPSVHSAQNSPRKDSLPTSLRTASGSPHRLSTLLTPPLTPSSSFNSASTAATECDFGGDADTVPSTPPDGGSPLTWGKLQLKRRSIVELGAADDIAMSAQENLAELNARMRRMDLTPRFEKKLVFGDISEQDAQQAPEVDTRASDDEKKPTRFLLIHHVPDKVVVSQIHQGLTRLGITRVKGIMKIQPQGLILIVFYDLSDARRAADGFDGKLASSLNKSEVRMSSSPFSPVVDERKEDDMRLRVEFKDKPALEKMLNNRPSTIWNGTESKVYVLASKLSGIAQIENVANIMASLGNIIYCKPAPSGAARALAARGILGQNNAQDIQAFVVDYYDCEHATMACQQFDRRVIFGLQLRIVWACDIDGVDEEEPVKEQVVPFPMLTCGSGASGVGVFDLASPPSSSLALPESPTPKRGNSSDLNVRARYGGERADDGSPRRRTPYDEQAKIDLSTANPSHYGGLRFNSLDGAPPAASEYADRIYGAANTVHNQYGAQFSGFDYAHHPFDCASPASHDAPHHLPSPETFFSQPVVPQYTGYQFPPPTPAPQFDPYTMPANTGYGVHRDSAGWMYPSELPPYDNSVGSTGLVERNTSSNRDGRKHSRPHRGQLSERSARGSSSAFGRSSSGESFDGSFTPSTELGFAEGTLDKGAVSEKNQLNIVNIENGLDTRTTVMIKNIPNKMSDADLMKFIDRVCPRRIDFLYLRMDFQNGCNVGYAFVNFITVQDLMHFATTQLGVKWNMYSSEKVLQMSYANYQGKEALVEKFKNSCIMDEREAWRPKIFFSDGPSQGLPEPFPPPTHLRRKERSASNRGALFVPGAHHYAHGHGHGPGHRQHHFHGQYREAGYGPRF